MDIAKVYMVKIQPFDTGLEILVIFYCTIHPVSTGNRIGLIT